VPKPRIPIPHDELAEFSRRHRIRRLALFGSVLRDDFSDRSDIDMLVEFEPGATPGFAFFAMQDELTAIFGRKVDLNTQGFLSKHFREEVLAQSEDVFVAA
jgi:predicted nucleotidyltransferase